MKKLIQYDDDGGMAVSLGLEPKTFQPGEIVVWGHGTHSSPRKYAIVVEQLSHNVLWVASLEGGGCWSMSASAVRRTPYMAIPKELPDA